MAALEIKDYVARASNDPTTDNIKQLWQAVFMLKAWYFIPTAPKEGPAYPYVAMLNDHPWLMAFTNVRCLQAFVRHHHLVADHDETFLLTLDPLQSMKRIQSESHNLHGIIFNYGSPETFRIPVDGIIQCARTFGLPLD